jgi:endonuclease/exonuclease/phosphatase family metal-dependent hydrolase
MAASLDEVARVIRDEQPDILLLQELDDGAKAVPLPGSAQAVARAPGRPLPVQRPGLRLESRLRPRPPYLRQRRKLATLSRYQIEHAERLQLPAPDANFISRQFQPKPALLLTYLPLSDGGQLAVLNTHLDGDAPAAAPCRSRSPPRSSCWINSKAVARPG